MMNIPKKRLSDNEDKKCLESCPTNKFEYENTCLTNCPSNTYKIYIDRNKCVKTLPEIFYFDENLTPVHA